MSNFTEAIVEQATIDWLTQLGYTIYHASKFPRQSCSDIILTEPLQTALETINPQLPPDIIQNTIKKLTRHNTPNLYENNYRYKREIPSLFPTNELLIISDGTEARIGTITADLERFAPWHTLDGETIVSKGVAELQTLILGIFPPKTLLDLLKSFIVFEIDGDTIIKKLAGYHQYHAVNKAITATLEATQPQGDKKVGVVWHTQGSGKSLTMAFYAVKIIQQSEMANPTLVILTDRNDLDDQLFNTFSQCSDLLRQTPQQAEDRENLQELLKVASGGIIFTTIQKFSPQDGNQYPTLSERCNIILIADEAHRSQYGLDAKVKIKKKAENNLYSLPSSPKLKVAESNPSYKMNPPKSPLKKGTSDIPPLDKGGARGGSSLYILWIC